MKNHPRTKIENISNKNVNSDTLSIWIPLKIISILLLILIDIGINSCAEHDYDSHDSNDTSHDTDTLKQRNTQILLFGIQIVTQVFLFSCLFVAFCETFLFQVGLLGVLFRDFWKTAVIQLVYGVLTLAVGGYRLFAVRTIIDFWGLPGYTSLSIAHKIVAPLFYAMNLSSVVELGGSKYHSKEAWINNPRVDRYKEAKTAVQEIA